MKSADLWDENGLHVWVQWGDSGNLLIQGQHLRAHSEYEYGIAIPTGEIHKIISALGGESGDDVIALIDRNAAAIVKQGELAWVKGLGIKNEFWSRSDGDDFPGL